MITAQQWVVFIYFSRAYKNLKQLKFYIFPAFKGDRYTVTAITK